VCSQRHAGPAFSGCNNSGWVCEVHDRADDCESALAPCPVCNHPYAGCPDCGERLNGEPLIPQKFIYPDVIDRELSKAKEREGKTGK
jgi:hypothetical protein